MSQLTRVLTVEAVLEEVSVWVQIVKDGIGIPLDTCCEDGHFKKLVCVQQALQSIWPHREAGTFCLLCFWIDDL